MLVPISRDLLVLASLHTVTELYAPLERTSSHLYKYSKAEMQLWETSVICIFPNCLKTLETLYFVVVQLILTRKKAQKSPLKISLLSFCVRKANRKCQTLPTMCKLCCRLGWSVPRKTFLWFHNVAVHKLLCSVHSSVWSHWGCDFTRADLAV